jgi:hypothetical protein
LTIQRFAPFDVGRTAHARHNERCMRKMLSLRSRTKKFRYGAVSWIGART